MMIINQFSIKTIKNWDAALKLSKINLLNTNYFKNISTTLREDTLR
jgi:hypothetical protein